MNTKLRPLTITSGTVRAARHEKRSADAKCRMMSSATLEALGNDRPTRDDVERVMDWLVGGVADVSQPRTAAELAAQWDATHCKFCGLRKPCACPPRPIAETVYRDLESFRKSLEEPT